MNCEKIYDMKILVCISRVPDTEARVAFKDGGSAFDESGVTFIMNPYDEWYALVRAIELKEALGGTVVAAHVGSSASDPIIRKALAIGADEAVRIDAEPKSGDFTAQQLAAFAKSENFDLILCGKETIDYNGAEVPAMLAELLDLPFVSHAEKLELEGNEYTLVRQIAGGTEEVKLEGPLVVSAAKGMAEQRIPNMRGIMMAKRKPLKVIPAAEGIEPKTVFVHFELPPAKKEVTLVDPENMDELVRLLHEEAKVI